jgi:menaquinone-dependent protoporphyrinogen IX oxidase
MDENTIPGNIEYISNFDKTKFKFLQDMEKTMFTSPLAMFQAEKKTPAEVKEEARLKRELKKFLAKAEKEKEMFRYLTFDMDLGYNRYLGHKLSIVSFSDEDLLSEIRYRMNQREDF